MTQTELSEIIRIIRDFAIDNELNPTMEELVTLLNQWFEDRQ